MDGFLVEDLMRYIGRTVTIFTTSGGLSGSGFTGVLAGVCDGTVKLITDIGAAPACPVGSDCAPGYGNGYGFSGGYGGYGYGGGYGGSYGGGCGCGGGYGGGFYGNNWLGSVTEIPIKRIASFTHNAI